MNIDDLFKIEPQEPYNMSQKEFVEKTGKKKGTMGDLYDRSQELSEKRKQKLGTTGLKMCHKQACFFMATTKMCWHICLRMAFAAR